MKNWWMITVVALVPLALAGCEDSPLEAAEEPAPVQALESADPGTGSGPAGRILDLSDELGLSDDQRAAIQDILAELRERNAPLLEGVERPDGPPRARRWRGEEPSSALQQVRQNSRAAMEAIQAVLTEEQQELARTLRQERGPGPEGHPRPGRRGSYLEGHPGPGQRGPGLSAGGTLLRMVDRLELTDEQVARIEAIQTSLTERLAALREKGGASADGPIRRRVDGEPHPLARELRGEIETALEEMRAVLTEEQRATLAEFRADRPRREDGTLGPRFRAGR